MKNLIDQSWKSYKLHIKNSFNRTLSKKRLLREISFREINSRSFRDTNKYGKIKDR